MQDSLHKDKKGREKKKENNTCYLRLAWYGLISMLYLRFTFGMECLISMLYLRFTFSMVRPNLRAVLAIYFRHGMAKSPCCTCDLRLAWYGLISVLYLRFTYGMECLISMLYLRFTFGMVWPHLRAVLAIYVWHGMTSSPCCTCDLRLAWYGQISMLYMRFTTTPSVRPYSCDDIMCMCCLHIRPLFLLDVICTQQHQYTQSPC